MNSLHMMIDGSVFSVAFALMEEQTVQACEMIFGVKKEVQVMSLMVFLKRVRCLLFEVFLVLLFRSGGV